MSNKKSILTICPHLIDIIRRQVLSIHPIYIYIYIQICIIYWYILYIDIISFIYYIDILSIYTLIGFNWRDGKIFPVPWTLHCQRTRVSAAVQCFRSSKGFSLTWQRAKSWLKCVEIPWKCVEICWNTLKFVEICWNTMEIPELNPIWNG